SFAVYMVPGLWGAPLKSISAFAPPLTTQDFSLYNEEVHASFTDYDEGMAYARKANKPVLVDFSGYGCVNCRKMEASVWTNSEVKSIIEKDYVLITLIVDDKTPLAEPVKIEEYGKTRTLRTVGDKWSYLERSKFGANAQPFYVLLDPSGMPIGPSYSFNESVPDYIKFLTNGLKEFESRK
ncbi:MAG: thioredoxin family protein, partial [Bacteroidales bacterium]